MIEIRTRHKRSEAVPSQVHVMVEVYDDWNLVGDVFGGFSERTPDKLSEMISAKLDEEYQGKGIGKQMYEAFIEESFRAGADRVSSGVVATPRGFYVWSSLEKNYPDKIEFVPTRAGATRFIVKSPLTSVRQHRRRM